MKLAVIPARGGSKRIPRKNVKQFCGKPIIAWSIEAAKESQCFDRIIVSTDDKEIAAVAEQYGAEAPFVRPDALSDDYVGTIPVIQHAINWVIASGEDPEFVCCLYATAPFVVPESLCSSLQRLKVSDAKYAFSVTNYDFPVQRAVRITSNGRVAMFNPEHLDTRSQDLEEAFHDAGQFYWGKAKAWLAGEPILGSASIPVILPRYKVQDIDVEEDWIRAEWLFRAMAAANGES